MYRGSNQSARARFPLHLSALWACDLWVSLMPPCDNLAATASWSLGKCLFPNNQTEALRLEAEIGMSQVATLDQSQWNGGPSNLDRACSQHPQTTGQEVGEAAAPRDMGADVV